MHIIMRSLYICMKFLIDIVGEAYYKIFGCHLFVGSLARLYDNLDENEKKILQEDKFLMENTSLIFKELSKTKMSLFGHIVTFQYLIRCIKNRAKFEDYYKNNRHLIDKVELVKPVFIFTQPRTGSSFLHCLLANDKSWFAPQTWMQMTLSISPSNPFSKFDLNELKKCEKEHHTFRSLNFWNDIKMTHDLDVTDPEDIYFELSCYGFFIQFYSMEGMEEFRHAMDSITTKQWIDIYKKMKRNFKCYMLNYKERRLLAMNHMCLGNLDAICQVFPDSKIITLYRDPIMAINSLLSLVSIMSRIYFPYWRCEFSAMKQPVVDLNVNAIVNYFEIRCRIEESEKKTLESSSRFIDICFNDFVRNPLEQVKKMYSLLEMELNDDTESILSEYIHQQVSHGKLDHKYKISPIDKDYYYTILQEYIHNFNIEMEKE
ncbi:unnamed protein product [Dimorphilus gyrociliatus]|uniref:Uncharacterized protein n=1 Tax=Dimorphilus gyrociliatus TaxID=2664684 RepID=A0A7I8VTT1_9ANNE|nr:unnamed protein product [Dimorphilus gyrociliatus]